MDFDTFDTTTHEKAARVCAAVRQYANRNQPGENLVLIGPPGTGKDHLAMSACLYFIAKHRQSCRRIDCAAWYAKLRDGITFGMSESRELDELVEPDVLLLSDPSINGKPATEHQADWLYRVVSARDVRQKRMIVTLNVPVDRDTPKHCRALLGAPAWDRMIDGASVFACNWPSYRKPGVTL